MWALFYVNFIISIASLIPLQIKRNVFNSKINAILKRGPWAALSNSVRLADA